MLTIVDRSAPPPHLVKAVGEGSVFTFLCCSTDLTALPFVSILLVSTCFLSVLLLAVSHSDCSTPSPSLYRSVVLSFISVSIPSLFFFPCVSFSARGAMITFRVGEITCRPWMKGFRRWKVEVEGRSG